MKNKATLFGIHAVKAAIKYDNNAIETLLIDKRRKDAKIDKIIEEAKRKNIKIERLDKKELDNLSKGENHQGVAVISSGGKPLGEADLFSLIQDLEESPFLLILDGVQDPHNLGACLRTANAAGVDAVIAPKDNATGLTPVVHKISCGASQATPFFQVTNLARTMKKLQKEGVWIIGAAGETEKGYTEVDYSGGIAIAMGAEGDGLRRLTKENCDHLVKIPMQGVVESLNVSVATGIMLFEAKKARPQSAENNEKI